MESWSLPDLPSWAEWAEKFAAMSFEGPAIKGLRRGKAQWLRPELRVRVQHLKARGMLRHASVKQIITD
jgi:hypothetical protein